MFDANGEHKRNMRMVGRIFAFGAVVIGLPAAICYLSQYVR